MDERDSIVEGMIAEVAEPTPEGLAVRRSNLENGTVLLEEVGHFDYVICQHRIHPLVEDVEERGFWVGGGRVESGIEFLAERVAELRQRCRSLEGDRAPSLDLPRWKRNLRAARRRLRRWIDTHRPTTLELSPELRAIVAEVIETAPETEFEFRMEMIERNLDLVTDYERRKAGAIVLLVSSVPERVRELLEEAREAYFLGLSRATVILCRTLLEELMKDLLSREEVRRKAVPIQEDRLEILINCLPAELLKSAGRQWAHEIRIQGNRALHDASAFSDEEALIALHRTSKIAEVLLNRAAELRSS